MDDTCVARRLRAASDVPIIMLTILDKDEEIVRGLNYGADDFVTKPFSREVLLARVRAVAPRRVAQRQRWSIGLS